MVAPLVIAGVAAGAVVTGLFFDDCEGAASEETKVKFHRSADLTEEEKAALRERLQEFEKLIRSFNPDLFHTFKRWHVASPKGVDLLHPGFEILSDPGAFYNPIKQECVIPPSIDFARKYMN